MAHTDFIHPDYEARRAQTAAELSAQDAASEAGYTKFSDPLGFRTPVRSIHVADTPPTNSSILAAS